MPDTGCATWDTEEDDRLERIEDNPVQGIPQEEIERVTEAVLEEKAEKFIENSEKNRYENQPPEARQEEPMATQKEIQTEKEYAKRIGMSSEERDFLPLAAGFEEKEIKEIVNFLHTGKIPIECWENETKVWKIAYIDKPGSKTEPGWITVARTQVAKEYIADHKSKSAIGETIRIFQNEKGERPTREERNLKIAHEIYHRNEPEFMDILDSHRTEWKRAVESQVKQGVISKYSVEDYTRSDIQFNPEFQAEHYKHWATDTPGLCKEMYDFFDQHFPKRTT